MEGTAPQLDSDLTTLRPQRILIVGGGAIGQVFGLHLQEGGAEIAFFLKPKYAGDAEEGFDLHRYGVSGVRPRRHLQGFDVYSDYRMLRTRRFDQIWLCVSSPALRDETIAQIHGSCPDALWVSFQPGVDDREYLSWRLQTTKIVTGMVNFVAYQAPLAGENLWPEGIAYFVPPWTMTAFTGPEPHVSIVSNLLRKGGLVTGVRPDTTELARFGSAVLMPFVMALEAMRWSWSDLRASDTLLDLVSTAVTEVQTAVEKSSGRTSGALSVFQKRWAWKMALFAAPRVAPFPIETYFQYHFSKVRPQSDQMADELAQHCRDNAVVPASLERLRDQWRSARPAHEHALDSDETDDTPVPAPRTTGMIPAILPAPIVDDEDDEISAPSPGSAAPHRAPIEVDFEPGGAELTPPRGAGLSEPTSDAFDPAVLLADVQDEQPEPPASAERETPILRSLADLDRVTAIPGPEHKPRIEAPTPLPAVKPLPFAFEPDDEPDDEPEVVVERMQEESLPSIIINEEMLTEETDRGPQPTIRDLGTVPAEVHFGERSGELSREDFIQTEFANEKQNASLRELKSKLRSRMGSSQRSPALKNDPSDD